MWAGCTTPAGPQVPTTRYVVANGSGAQFYKYGPAQAFGPDSVLPRGYRLTMVDRAFGYSRVALADGMNGYVSTEDVAPAPPDPVPPKATPPPKVRTGRGSSGSRRGSSPPVVPIPSDPLFDINDVPLPMPDVAPATPQ